MENGTGVVKITPAHDPNDYEVGQRHNLPIIKVMNDDATMTEACGKYAGMTTGYEARKAIVADLEEHGYLLKSIEELHPQRRHLLPLPHHRRADGLQAVVCQDGAAGQAGH